MQPIVQRLAGKVERWELLDRVGVPAQTAVRGALSKHPAVKDALSGTWLGHPVHPPLTDVAIGAWTSALGLDLVGGEASQEAADVLIALGTVAALPTAAAGLSDWADVPERSRRVGSVHAAGNVTALVLHALSWRARRRGRRRAGIALSMLGYGFATGSAWLGGHLSFTRGVGVNQTAFDQAPSDWTPVLEDTELTDGGMAVGQVGGLDVLLSRVGDRIYALDDRCSHRGCALHEGELRDHTVTCPCHGSRFALDGSLIRGPATAPQPSYDARVRGGTIEIRRV
jgi:nitrite reductase/ring-hydroxylating ferredoxin subunit/uncharacterized membrane protein